MLDVSKVLVPRNLSREQAFSLAEVLLEPYLEDAAYASSEYFLTLYFLNSSWGRGETPTFAKVASALLRFLHSDDSVETLSTREAFFSTEGESAAGDEAVSWARTQAAYRAAKAIVEVLQAMNFEQGRASVLVLVRDAVEAALEDSHGQQSKLREALTNPQGLSAAGHSEGLRSCGGAEHGGPGPVDPGAMSRAVVMLSLHALQAPTFDPSRTNDNAQPSRL